MMKRAIRRLIFTTSLIFILTVICQAQPSPSSFELPCPAGTSPLGPSGWTVNPNTGLFRAWVCVDPNGTVSSPVFSSGTSPQTKAAIASQWLISYSAVTGLFTSGQPAVTDVSGAAPLASPTFTGTPAAPTAASTTNTTQIATTGFVRSLISPSSTQAGVSNVALFDTSGANPNKIVSDPGITYDGTGATGKLFLGSTNIGAGVIALWSNPGGQYVTLLTTNTNVANVSFVLPPETVTGQRTLVNLQDNQAFTGNNTFPTLGTSTNCAAIGTAANPSVASCATAAAGSFSCATNASTGTCQVNTTRVTTNSEIFITGRNDTVTGTRLGVTCNTGITTALPEIASVNSGVSFTINLGTFTVNPECFSYFIVNL